MLIVYTCIYICIYIYFKFFVQNSFADRCITLNIVFCLQCTTHIYMLFYVLFNCCIYLYIYSVFVYDVNMISLHDVDIYIKRICFKKHMLLSLLLSLRFVIHMYTHASFLFCFQVYIVYIYIWVWSGLK